MESVHIFRCVLLIAAELVSLYKLFGLPYRFQPLLHLYYAVSLQKLLHHSQQFRLVVPVYIDDLPAFEVLQGVINFFVYDIKWVV